MNTRKIVYVLFIFVLALAISACGQADNAASPEGAAQPVETGPIQIGSEIRFSGQGSQVTDAFTLEGPYGIEVFWQQECSYFLLLMQNTNETLAEAPMGSVTFESTNIPNQFIEKYPGYRPFEYLPGEYAFHIECEGDGAWEMWAKIVSFEQ